MRHTYPQNSLRGFSVVELLVVLAIIAILAMVTVSGIGSKQKAAVRELTQQMNSSLADAQQLARTSGRPVTLHVKGSTSDILTIDFEYVANPATPLVITRGGGFNAAAQQGGTSYAAIGIGQAQLTATGVALASLKGLAIMSDWTTFFDNANAIFQGAESQALSFSNNGQISQDCYLTVSGPSPGPSSPLGVVIATRRNGIHAYFFSGEPGAVWRSL